MEKTVKFSAKSMEEALQKAAESLGIKQEDVKVNQTEESKGFLGLGKKVTIEVLVTNAEETSVKTAEPTKIKEVKEAPKKEVNTDEYVEFLEYMNKIISHFQLEAKIEVTENDNKIRFNIETDNNSILIGKSGATLNSLEKLVQQLANKVYKNSKVRKKIRVDVGNYKKERIDRLKDMAISMGEKVATTGRSIKMKPMNAYERRVVHSALSENENVETVSVGQDPARYIIIKPL